MSRVRFRIRVLVSRAVAPQTPSSRYIPSSSLQSFPGHPVGLEVIFKR